MLLLFKINDTGESVLKTKVHSLIANHYFLYLFTPVVTALSTVIDFSGLPFVTQSLRYHSICRLITKVFTHYYRF
jgi:hypothetical protein